MAADPGGRLRVRLAADYERLEFLRVLRHHGTQDVSDSAQVIADGGPLPPVEEEPEPEPAPEQTEATE